jgi:hypothetical protein
MPPLGLVQSDELTLIPAKHISVRNFAMNKTQSLAIAQRRARNFFLKCESELDAVLAIAVEGGDSPVLRMRFNTALQSMSETYHEYVTASCKLMAFTPDAGDEGEAFRERAAAAFLARSQAASEVGRNAVAA